MTPQTTRLPRGTFPRTRSLRQALLAGLLGSAALLPAFPAWAEPPAAVNGPAPAKPVPPAAGQPTDPTKDAVKSDARVNTTDEARDGDSQARRQAMLDERKARLDDRTAFREAHLAGLHAGLQLTATQQPLWPAVETALRDTAQARDALRDLSRRGPGMSGPGMSGPGMDAPGKRAAADEGADPLARLKQRGERLVAMGQAVGKLADAAGPLLAALTPQQKDRLPVLLRGVGPRRLVGEAFGLDAMRRGDGGRSGMGRAIGDGRHREGRDGRREDRFIDRMADRMGDGRDERGDGWSRHRRFERDGGDNGFGPRGGERDERSGG